MKLLIASPPCQAWSMAGKREGLKDQARVFDLCSAWADDPTAPRPTDWHDDRSPLAAEPMRWAATLRPELMAWEQVPPVLDLWAYCADLLRPLGYSTWTGILNAERFGVPQTRKRAILLASRVGQVHPPMPTHQAYVAGEPARHDFTLEGEILPWVSMAEALGWTDERREAAPYQGSGQIERHGEVRRRCEDEPAPTLRAGGGSNASPGFRWRVGFPRNADEGEATEDGYRARDFRDQDEPAPTITGGHDTGDRVWTGDPRDPNWPNGRPATTLAGDPRVPGPGHKLDKSSPDSPRRMENAVRVTVEEASILQSFDPAYPWQGSRTAQFQQIGNAVPPLLPAPSSPRSPKASTSAPTASTCSRVRGDGTSGRRLSGSTRSGSSTTTTPVRPGTPRDCERSRATSAPWIRTTL